MRKYKVLFCDLDGTLIDTLSGETFPKGIWDMKIKFDVLDAIKKLAPEFVFIVTNQGGIESGFVDQQHFIIKLTYVRDCIYEYSNIDKFKVECCFCASNDKNNSRRKPNLGMLSYCLDNFVPGGTIARNEILMIGDASGLEGQWSDTDKKTAENFEIDYLDVNEFVSLYREDNDEVPQ